MQDSGQIRTKFGRKSARVGTRRASNGGMNPNQERALVQLRQSVVGILPDLWLESERRAADVRLWLSELERHDLSFSRVRSTATALRSLGKELEDQDEARQLSAAAASLVEAAGAVLIAF